MRQPDSPPLLAAGGLADGNHTASVLALGAAGAVFGTRFLLSDESLYTTVQKTTLLNAIGDSTIRTVAFDQARGTLGWPEGIDGRALRNSMT
jgi:nitronate monooxygenase